MPPPKKSTAARLRDAENLFTTLKTQDTERRRRLHKLEMECKELSERVTNIAKSEQVLMLMSQEILGKSTATIDDLLTNGLRAVFNDQSLTFKTTIDKYRGRTAVKFQLLENGYSKPLMESYGGGPLAMAALLLRIATIILLDMRRVLFLDETLAHLSEAYHANASKLLKSLCRELDFQIVMITHQPAFAEYADNHYEVTPSHAGPIFTRVNPGKAASKGQEIPGEEPGSNKREAT